MGTPESDRLLKARKSAQISGPAEAAAAMGISRFTYTQHENGTRGFKKDSAARYAKKFRVSLEWLLTGKGDMKGKPETVPVVGMVGAGAKIIPFPDQGALDDEPLLKDMAGVEAARIRGGSMPPFQDGWLIFWRQQNEGVTQDCIGKLCVLDVKEGPMLVKIVQQGSKRGLWNLVSWKGPDLEDQVLNWASPVLYIQPK